MTRVPTLDTGDGERTRADTAYATLKNSIFEFVLLPGDRFTENEMAARLGMSRTPVREALYRLEREGYTQVHFRVGWSVRAFDFAQFENLYDLRLVLELASVQRLCDRADRPDLDAMKAVWLAPASERATDPMAICTLDEGFHAALVEAAGNPEVARCHREVTERIRIIRRLDFTQTHRVDRTYEEHAQILRAVMRRRGEQAALLLKTHVEASKAEVRKITLHRLATARRSLAAD